MMAMVETCFLLFSETKLNNRVRLVCCPRFPDFFFIFIIFNQNKHKKLTCESSSNSNNCSTTHYPTYIRLIFSAVRTSTKINLEQYLQLCVIWLQFYGVYTVARVVHTLALHFLALSLSLSRLLSKRLFWCFLFTFKSRPTYCWSLSSFLFVCYSSASSSYQPQSGNGRRTETQSHTRTLRLVACSGDYQVLVPGPLRGGRWPAAPAFRVPRTTTDARAFLPDWPFCCANF